MAVVKARYEVMRAECRYLCEFSLLQQPFDREGRPREAERFVPLLPKERPNARLGVGWEEEREAPLLSA
jgi:hypothetical protein